MAWIDRQVERTGDVELVRTRPWAAVARVPSTVGDLWFKESAPAFAFEPRLTQAIARRRPDRLPQLVAADGPRMLTRDAGSKLHDLLEAGAPAPPWEEILPLFAELQIELIVDVDELLALGTPDRRPGALPSAYREFLERVRTLDEGMLRRLHSLEPEVQRLADLVATSVPTSISHEEVQEHNVFVRNGEPVFIDWAEACVSHPFAGLVNTLRWAVDRHGLEPGGAEVLELRDSYLEPWTRFASPRDLQAAFRSAYALGALSRVLTMDLFLAPLTPEARKEYDFELPAWLEVFAAAVEAPDRLGA